MEQPEEKPSKEDDSTRQNVTLRIFFVLASGFLMNVALGQAYSVGNYAPYFISYFKNRTDETEIENVDILWFSAVAGGLDWIGLIFGGVLERMMGPRITILIGSVIFGGSLAVSYFTVKMSYVVFLIPYAAINSVSGILVYGIAAQTAVQWLPHRASLATGIVLSGYGAGALVFNQVITHFVNPDNVSPDLIIGNDRYFTDPDLLDRVPYLFVLLGGISFVMMAIGSLGMVPPQTNKQQTTIVSSEIESCQTSFTDISSLQKGDHETISGLQTGNTDKEDIEQNTEKMDISTASLKTVLKVVLTTRSFYILWIQVLCAVWGFLFLAFLYKAYAQTFIEDDHFISLTGTLASIFNSAGRPMWGLVMDRFGYKVTVRCITLGFSVFCATLFLTEKINKMFFLFWVCMMYFTYCGNWAVGPAVIARLFSAKNMSFNYGFIMCSVSIASVGVLITSTSLKAIIGWHGMFFISAGLGIVPFILSFFFNGVDVEGKPI